MITVETFVKLSFILINIVILSFYLPAIYSVRRAEEQTQISPSMPWKWLMLIAFLLVIFNIVFVVVIKL